MPAKDSHTTYPTTVGASGGTITAPRRNNLTGSGDFQSQAAMAVRPVGVGFSSTGTSGNTATGTFTLKGGSTAQLATVFRTDARAGKGGPSVSTLAGQASGKADGLTDPDMAALLAGHRAWWKNFWLKSLIQTGDATTNGYWYGSLYATGSASRPGKVLAGMNGP